MVIEEVVEAETGLLMLTVAAAAIAVVLVALMDLQMRDLRKRVTLLEMSLRRHTVTTAPAGLHTHELIRYRDGVELTPHSALTGMPSPAPVTFRPAGHHTHTVIVNFPFHTPKEY